MTLKYRRGDSRLFLEATDLLRGVRGATKLVQSNPPSYGRHSIYSAVDLRGGPSANNILINMLQNTEQTIPFSSGQRSPITWSCNYEVPLSTIDIRSSNETVPMQYRCDIFLSKENLWKGWWVRRWLDISETTTSRRGCLASTNGPSR